jgi:hypothetical protein
MDSRRTYRWGLLVLATLLAGAGVEPARAASVTEVNTSYTVGVQGHLYIDSFSVAGPGTVTVTLSELKWPTDNLANVSFELTSGSNQVVGLLSGSNTQTFSLSTAGTYYALSYGQALPASGSLLPFATYGINISYAPSTVPSPVPLPPSAALLVSGLLGLLLTANGGRSRVPVPTSG